MPFDDFLYSQNLANAPAQPQDNNDTSRGFQIGWGQTTPLLQGAVGLVGATMENALGEGGISTGIKNWGLNKYTQGMKALEPLQRENDDVTVAWEKAKQGDLGALVDVAQYGVGYTLAQAAQSGIAAAAGAFAGSALGPGGTAAGAVEGAVAPGVVKQMVAGYIEKQVAKEAARLAATKEGEHLVARVGQDLAAQEFTKMATASVAGGAMKSAGATAMMGVQNAGMELGGIYAEAEGQAAKDGTKLDGGDLARIWGSGLAAAAMETVTDRMGLDALSGKFTLPGTGKLLGATNRGLVGGAVGAFGEAGTEFAQTAMERYGAGKSLTDQDAINDYINSAALGGLGGGMFGGVGGALHNHHLMEAQQAVARDLAFSKIMGSKTVDEAITAQSDSVAGPVSPTGGGMFSTPGGPNAGPSATFTPESEADYTARMEKMAQAIDKHIALLSEANKQANPENRAAAFGAVQDQVQTDLGASSLTRPSADMAALPQATPMADLQAKEAAVQGRRAEADMPASLPDAAAPKAAPVHWVDTTPVTDLNVARERLAHLRERAPEFGVNPNDMVLAPHPTQVGAFAVRTVPGRDPQTSRVVATAQAPQSFTPPALPDGPRHSVPLAGESAGKRIPKTEPQRPAPKQQPIVDDRALDAREAKLRLVVMRDQLKLQGGDPASLVVVPHPQYKGKYAIASLNPEVRLDPTKTGNTALAGEVGVATMDKPVVLNPVQIYVKSKRTEGTEQARAFIKDYDAGKITDADVQKILDQESKAKTAPQPLGYEKDGTPKGEIVADGKERGERTGLPVPSKETYKPTDRVLKRISELADDVDNPESQRIVADFRSGKLTYKKADELFFGPMGDATETPPAPPAPEKPPVPEGKRGPMTQAEVNEKLPINNDNPELRKNSVDADFGGMIGTLLKSQNPVVRRIAELGKKLIGITKLTKPHDAINNNPRILGIYRYGPMTDSITLKTDHAGDEWTASHELTHAVLARILDHPTPQQLPYVNKIKALFKHVKTEMKKDGKFWVGKSGNTYGLADIHEFLSEAWSNQTFQKDLMNIPYKSTTVWSDFINAVAALLGFKENNAFAEALALSEKLGEIGRKKGQNVKTVKTFADEATNSAENARKPTGENNGTPEPPGGINPTGVGRSDGKDSGGSVSQEGTSQSSLASRRDYSNLSDRKISYPVKIEDTGETAQVTVAADKALQAGDDRIEALERLSKCIG